jgi:hypothetical protein
VVALIEKYYPRLENQSIFDCCVRECSIHIFEEYAQKAMENFSFVFIRESEVHAMTIKHSKTLAIVGVAILSSIMFTPAYAEDSVVPVVTTTVSSTGTINVLSRVVNDNLGTKFPTDFSFNLRHHGTDVAGSPFTGAGNVGTKFVVEAGTYVVSTPIVDGYDGIWFNGGKTNGLITLKAGEEITMVRIFSDAGVSDAVVMEEPTTEDGGLLPNTATPWFNFLLFGSIIAAAGAFGLRKSLNLHKAI